MSSWKNETVEHFTWVDEHKGERDDLTWADEHKGEIDDLTNASKILESLKNCGDSKYNQTLNNLNNQINRLQRRYNKKRPNSKTSKMININLSKILSNATELGFLTKVVPNSVPTECKKILNEETNEINVSDHMGDQSRHFYIKHFLCHGSKRNNRFKDVCSLLVEEDSLQNKIHECVMNNSKKFPKLANTTKEDDKSLLIQKRLYYNRPGFKVRLKNYCEFDDDTMTEINKLQRCIRQEVRPNCNV